MDSSYRIIEKYWELTRGTMYQVKDIYTKEWGVSKYFTPNQCRDVINNMKHLITERRIRIKK